MVYFCATSVFHLLMIIYLLETEYKSSERPKTLILLNHVPGLMQCYPRIQSSGLWDHVICIHTDKATTAEMGKQLDLIEFQPEDSLHIFGKEFVGFYLLRKANKMAKCILTDEGILSNTNIKKVINLTYHSDWFAGEGFDFNCIDEVWMMDASVLVDSAGITVKDLKMQEMMNRTEFRKRYISKLETVFPKAECGLKTSQICFFDTYYLQIYHCMSEDLEQYLLEQATEGFEKYDVSVKPHPGERNYKKYNKIKDKICKESYIPWEVLRFYETEQTQEKRIVISYSVTGAILHERLFSGADTQIIFLNKIYDKFSTNSVDVSNLVPCFINRFGEQNVYFPENFTEMRMIINSILGKEDAVGNVDTGRIKDEKRKQLTFFVDFYKSNWMMIPSMRNYTSIMVLKDGVYQFLEEKVINTQDGNFDFTFSVNFTSKENVRWYMVRSRKILVKITKIICRNNGAETEIDLGRLVYNGAEDREDGYKDMVTLEPSVDFELPCGKADEIQICGEWKFDFSYSGLIELSRKVMKRYDQHIELLHMDISERDEQLEAVHKDLIERDEQLEAVHKDLIERDEQLEAVHKDLIERDEQLVAVHKDLVERDKHLSGIYQDIHERDNHLKAVYKRLEKSEIHVELLKQDIAERDDIIKQFKEECAALREEMKHCLPRKKEKNLVDKLLRK